MCMISASGLTGCTVPPHPTGTNRDQPLFQCETVECIRNRDKAYICGSVNMQEIVIITNQPSLFLPPGDNMLNMELERYENAALAALALFEQDIGTWCFKMSVNSWFLEYFQAGGRWRLMIHSDIFMVSTLAIIIKSHSIKRMGQKDGKWQTQQSVNMTELVFYSL